MNKAFDKHKVHFYTCGTILALCLLVTLCFHAPWFALGLVFSGIVVATYFVIYLLIEIITDYRG